MSSSREYLRFRWSHEARLHRLAVRLFNRVMRLIPFRLKYAVGLRMRRTSMPYCLISEGATVVQIGAPQDTLLSGRSRAMYFALLAGRTGRVIVFEPDASSAATLKRLAREHQVDALQVETTAAWSEPTALAVYVDDSHPASNFTEGTKEYDAARMQDYRRVSIDADTVDNVIARAGLGHVTLVSITTNGAEPQIIEGMRETIGQGLPYISLARTGKGYIDRMRQFGYELISHDDRGYTFGRQSAT